MGEKHRAIPQGYMTVGEVAKKMGVTVRTLQYYDKQGLLPPSAESEGGLRLYTNKELVKLHQIRAMKQLGLTLEEIKSWLPAQNTPEEVSNVLIEQAKEIRKKIKALADVLESIEVLNTEVLQTKNVDWRKYADIFSLLQDKSELYWVISHLPEKLYEQLDITKEEDSEILMNNLNLLLEKVSELQEKSISPESEQGQDFAKKFWDVVMEITGGDADMMSELGEIAVTHGDSKWKSRQPFITRAVNLHLKNLECQNPLLS